MNFDSKTMIYAYIDAVHLGILLMESLCETVPTVFRIFLFLQECIDCCAVSQRVQKSVPFFQKIQFPLVNFSQNWQANMIIFL